MNQLRCAIYARFSSDRQSPTSITDQVRKCREHARQNGWHVLDEHLYFDEAISGASTDRAGLQRLLAAVAGPSIPFDCILIDDSSRLTRRLADALNLFERLTFAGIRIVAVSQGVDSDNPQAELLMSVHGMIDAVYWRELAQKTHRGMQGRALGGLATGGRCFGYRSVKDADQAVRLQVEESEAVIVRRLFEMYASGLSLKRIAWQLNAEAVKSPQPQKGRVSRSWCVSSIRHILRNPRYRGQVVWNSKRKIRVPGTGRRIYRRRPESEWVITDAPHLRIISDELFASVTRRFKVTQGLWGQGKTGLSRGQQKQVYLFSGLLHCSECGGSITLVAGRAKTSRSEYGCSLHAQRGKSVCANDLLIRRDHLEERLISGLKDQVLRAEAVDYVVAGLQQELQRRHESLNSELRAAREVSINGTEHASVVQRKIDHPADPANKYLVHAAVQSSEMMNMYTGNVVLDADGAAVVQLPGWFQAENADFRYSLSAVGAPAPNLYVAEEVSGNQFKVAGGRAGQKISWYVTAIPQDVYAKANPLVVEEVKKPKEQGYYMNPELYGQAEEKGLKWARHPQMMKRMKATREKQMALVKASGTAEAQPAPRAN